MTRRTPFPNHRFLGTSSPAFKRYYEGAKTASVRFLTSLFARIGYPDVSQCFAYTGCETPPAYLGLGRPVALLLVSFRRGNRRLSHVPVKPALHLLCCHTPGGPWHLPFYRAFGTIPVDPTTKTPSINHYYEALYQGFCNHCLRFMQAFLPTMQDSFPAEG